MSVENPFSVVGKTILVTGASSGIGKETAILLSNLGAKVILLARRLDILEKVAMELSTEYQLLKLDLNDENQIENYLDTIPDLDGIVHAAGNINKFIPFKLLNKTKIKDSVQINFYAPIFLTQKLLSLKKIKNGASIIFITSISGSIISSKANFSYTVAKGALAAAVKSLALDLAPNKIRVNNIAPGMILTEGANVIINNVSKEDIENDIKKYPLAQYGEPSDVSNACIYFLSNASKWVTGSTLVIDGGFTIL